MQVTVDQDGFVLDCPAKLNLTLGVGAPRSDGLHPIASVMVPLAFKDRLRIKTLNEGPSQFIRQWAADAPRPAPIDWPIEQDLIYRAHALMESQAGKALPVQCDLVKRIPPGAGLAGGSSNAAGMLVLLRELFDLDVSDQSLVDLGAALGADVSFMVGVLTGLGAAQVTGIGEVVKPMPRLPAFDLVLVFPDGACPTPDVYRRFDDQPGDARTVNALDNLVASWAWSSRYPMPKPMNDLTDAAIAVCPAIRDAMSTLSALGHTAHLTGSGSALFVLAQDAQRATQIAEESVSAGLPAVATRFVPAPK